MRSHLLRRAGLVAGGLLRRHRSITTPELPVVATAPSPLAFLAFPFRSFSDSNSPPPDVVVGTSPTSLAEADKSDPPFNDVSDAELKSLLEKYFEKDDEELLPEVFKAILQRRLHKNHEKTDEELLEELRSKPLPEVTDRDFENDFEEMHDTDEEIDNLYNARQYVEKKLMKDEFFNMDDKKWDGMIQEATEKGFLKDTKECEDILEDMLNYDKLLPDDIKKKVEAKFNELGDMCERGEMEPEQAYQLFQEFEDKIVAECIEIMDAEALKQPPEEGGIADADKKVELDDPPGEGPILRWESTVVFGPGGDAYHPKNRKVKLSVTVKELGLSKYAFRRLREVVGKRYHSGKDELTITSERFEHREENRKDCLRTLYALIEDAKKADQLVEVARNSYVKDSLRADPQFMERLKAKIAKLQGKNIPA